MGDNEIQSLITLLKSEEPQYWEIAFQIMKGTGVPDHPEVYRYATNNNHKILLSYQHNLMYQLNRNKAANKAKKRKKHH